MLDIKFVRENPDIVKENIKKKFQDKKLPLVDEVIELDKVLREARLKGDTLRADRNSKSSEIGNLMRNKEIEKANAIKAEVSEINKELEEMVDYPMNTDKNIRSNQTAHLGKTTSNL